MVLKYMFVAVAAMGLAGCGGLSRVEAKLTGSDIVCVEGVKYVQFVSGVSVQYNKDGSIATC